MNKILSILLTFTMMIALSACNNGSATSNDNVETIITLSTSSDTSLPDTNEEQLLDIDIFDDVQIRFDGWNEFGIITEILTDNCDNLIRENVRFSFVDDYQELSNGDIVTITAEYDEQVFAENGFSVISNTKDYVVEGLRKIVIAQDYHDGVAWVNVRFIDDTRWCCCDQAGNILFSLEAGSTPTTHFANGVAIVDYNRIVNKSGDIVWSIEEHGVSQGCELWGEGNVKSIEILFDSKEEDYFGYTFVQFYVDSFDLTAELTGVIDNEGNWYLEPENAWYVYSQNGIYEYYIPEGYNLPHAGEWYIINLSTKEVAERNSYNEIKNSKHTIWSRDFQLSIHDGLIFKWENYPDSSGFYNAEGIKAIDLSQYNLVTYVDEPEFNEGYALLEIENEQGSAYYTIIDTIGTEMFAPQKSVEHGKLRCGYYWVNGVGYMNTKGEIAFDLTLESGTDFSENMAAVTIGTNIHYINTSGEIVY